MQKIVLTGGGTAGHVTPILALLPYLKQKFEIHYIGSENGMEKKLLSDYSYVTYHSVKCIKLVRGLSLNNLKIPFTLSEGIRESRKLLEEIQPDVIFSKGGYVALPVCLAAKNIPYIIHESDLAMGLSNKLVAKKSAVVCTSFPDTARKYKNAVVTGIPLRQELFTAAPMNVRFNEALPTVLIMGGSQGAKAINDCVIQAADLLLEKYNIIHITGAGNKTEIKSADKGVYFQLEYTKEIQNCLHAADVVVSRGGAGSLFEIIALQKPAVIIPLPKKRSRGDQIANAEYFASLGCCYNLSQSMLTCQSLSDAIDKLIKDDEIPKRLRNRQNINGTQKVLDIIYRISEEKKQCKN